MCANSCRLLFGELPPAQLLLGKAAVLLTQVVANAPLRDAEVAGEVARGDDLIHVEILEVVTFQRRPPVPCRYAAKGQS